jgi:hypothetical protein
LLEDSVVKKTESRKPANGPTEKQLAYVKKLAEKTGVKLKEEDLSDFEKVSALYIDKLQKMIKPTEKQVAFAKKLSEERNISVPERAYESKTSMSKWISKVLENEE